MGIFSTPRERRSGRRAETLFSITPMPRLLGTDNKTAFLWEWRVGTRRLKEIRAHRSIGVQIDLTQGSLSHLRCPISSPRGRLLLNVPIQVPKRRPDKISCVQMYGHSWSGNLGRAPHTDRGNPRKPSSRHLRRRRRHRAPSSSVTRHVIGRRLIAH